MSLLFITCHVAIIHHPALNPIEVRYSVLSQFSAVTPSSLFCGVQLGAFVMFMMDGEADELSILKVKVEFAVISKTQFEKVVENVFPLKKFGASIS